MEASESQRVVYIITYSRADTEKFRRETFGEAIFFFFLFIFFFIVCKITLLTLLTVRAKYITRQYSILPTIHVYWLLTLLNKTGLYLQFNTDSLKHNSN